MDLTTIRLETVKYPKIKNGILNRISKNDILISTWVLTSSAIPVTPPSKKPLGSKNALSPILARTIPKAIWRYSEISLKVFVFFNL